MSADLLKDLEKLTIIFLRESHSGISSPLNKLLFSLQNTSSHRCHAGGHALSLSVAWIWVVLNISEIVVSGWKEDVQELIEAKSTVQVGVELGNDLLAVTDSGVLHEVVLEESQDFIWGQLSIFGGVKDVEKGSLVRCELSHVRENLAETLNVAFFQGNAFAEVSDQSANWFAHLMF